MKIKPVQSSMINSVGYNTPTKDLHIEFNTGNKYVYSNVPVSKYRALMKAQSKGKYLNKSIKSKHEYRKLEDLEKEASIRGFLSEVKKFLDVPSGIPVHKSFEDFMKTVHPGDVIVTKMSKADMAARAIELRQALGFNSHFGWTHAALAKSDGAVIHSFSDPKSALPDLKVRQDNLKDLYDRGLDMMVLKPRVPPEKKVEAIQRAEDLKGVPYKWSSILSSALGLKGPKIESKPSAVICTGTIAHAYPDLNITSSGSHDSMLVTDLINSKDFTPTAAVLH